MTMIEAKYKSEITVTKGILYLAVTGELWGAYCEDL